MSTLEGHILFEFRLTVAGARHSKLDTFQRNDDKVHADFAQTSVGADVFALVPTLCDANVANILR
jgi:hypothetical protein